jgi:hypothetical protein
MYPGDVTNRTSFIIDAAFIDMSTEKLAAKQMLSPGEVWELVLPAGEYWFVASCSKGYFEMKLKLPEMLKNPDGMWHITLWGKKPRRM